MFCFVAIAGKRGFMAGERGCFEWGISLARDEPAATILIYKARAGEKKARLYATLHDETITYQRGSAVREIAVKSLLAVVHGKK